jgi:hypothetical protein
LGPDGSGWFLGLGRVLPPLIIKTVTNYANELFLNFSLLILSLKNFLSASTLNHLIFYLLTNIILNFEGWDEGVLGMQVGEVARLQVPLITFIVLEEFVPKFLIITAFTYLRQMLDSYHYSYKHGMMKSVGI